MIQQVTKSKAILRVTGFGHRGGWIDVYINGRLKISKRYGTSDEFNALHPKYERLVNLINYGKVGI